MGGLCMSELSKTELQDYLNEINEQNISSDKLSSNDIAFMHLQEQLKIDESDTNFNTDEAYIRTSQTKGSMTTRYEERKRIERETKIEALNQNYLDLSSFLSVSDKKTLIELLVKGYTDNMIRHKGIIESVFNKFFKKLIPLPLLNAWQKYPESVVPFPGFMYTCTKEYGNEQQYWVTLNLPMYFRPEVCEKLFKDKCQDKVMKVEKSINQYFYHKKLRAETEIKYAKTLIGISTYFQLLKQKPYWYYLLITYLKKKNGWE